MIQLQINNNYFKFNKNTKTLILQDKYLDPDFKNDFTTQSLIQKEDIKHIAFKYNNTILPQNASRLFNNFENLESIEFEKVSFEKVQIIDQFVNQCPKIKHIHIKNMNNSYIKHINLLLYSLPSLTSLTIEDATLHHLKSIHQLIFDMPSLTFININHITAPKLALIGDFISFTPKLLVLKIQNIYHNIKHINTIITNAECLRYINIDPLPKLNYNGPLFKDLPNIKTDLITLLNHPIRPATGCLENVPTFNPINIHELFNSPLNNNTVDVLDSILRNNSSPCVNLSTKDINQYIYYPILKYNKEVNIPIMIIEYHLLRSLIKDDILEKLLNLTKNKNSNLHHKLAIKYALI